MNNINDLNPRPDDMVVVPEEMQLDRPDDGFSFHVYRMKFLRSPSIIRSGGYSMGFLSTLANTSLGQFFGIKPTEEKHSLRDEIFSKEYGEKLRGDSSYQMGTPANFPGITPVDGPEPESDVEPGPRIVTGYISSMKAHHGLPDVVLPLAPSVAKSVVEMARATNERASDIAGFFRYVRAKQLKKYPRMNVSGMPEFDMEVSPKGGVAFYIELDAANKSFAFSYALCHNNDNFNYEIARNICKGRFDEEIWYEVQNYDDKYSVVENISVAIHNFLYNRDSDVEGLIRFSSTPEADKVNYEDLKEIYKRI